LGCFADIIDNKNKVKYRRLLDYVDYTAQSDFLKEVGMPFLMGKDLYEGHLGANSDQQDTLKFVHVNDVAETIKYEATTTEPVLRTVSSTNASGIAHAVYAVKKSTHSDGNEFNQISIGRSTDNDISIVDYAISKNHAVIHHLNGIFYIRDLNSTNGVSVNSVKVGPDVDFPIQFGSTINIGRFGLVFARPIDLYNSIKTEVMIEKAKGLRAHGAEL